MMRIIQAFSLVFFFFFKGGDKVIFLSTYTQECVTLAYVYVVYRILCINAARQY